jgi:hypothetical protein
MTSNKKLVTMLLFFASLAFTVLSYMIGLRVLEATDLQQIVLITQVATDIAFLAGIISYCVIIALISDMD